MKIAKHWFFIAAALVCGGLASSGAAQVVYCEAAGIPDVNFGEHTQFQPAIDATSSGIQFRCKLEGLEKRRVNICIGLDNGTGGLLSNGQRRLPNTSNSAYDLGAQLYQDPPRTKVWGTDLSIPDQSSGVVHVQAVLEPGVVATIPVPSAAIYGRLFAPSQLVAPGVYESIIQPGIRYGDVGVEELLPPNKVCHPEFAPTAISANPFRVRVESLPLCKVQIDGGPLNFGTHTDLSSEKTSAVKLLVECPEGWHYRINADAGLYPDHLLRRMRRITNPIDWVYYELYLNSWNQPMGSLDGQVAGMTNFEFAGTGQMDGYEIIGKTPGQATPMVGVYQDTVVITVSY